MIGLPSGFYQCPMYQFKYHLRIAYRLTIDYDNESFSLSSILTLKFTQKNILCELFFFKYISVLASFYIKFLDICFALKC